METHPILGFNYRISEVHAAIGLAQTRKVPGIAKTNRRYKKMLTEMLSASPAISFAHVADPEGDSATFLNILLPDGNIAKAAIDEMNKAGIGGFNYWFTNMYHFINQWDHLKSMTTVSKLPAEVFGIPQDYSNLQLPKTQDVVSRLISFGIRCTWTEEEVKQLGQNILQCVNKAASTVSA